MAILFVEERLPFGYTNVPCTRTEEQLGHKAFGHTQFWAVQRAAAGQMGHFMLFNLNGERHAIDASVPTTLDRIPKDAVEVTGELAERIWHCQCGSHVMGCCYLQETRELILHEQALRRTGKAPPKKRHPFEDKNIPERWLLESLTSALKTLAAAGPSYRLEKMMEAGFDLSALRCFARMEIEFTPDGKIILHKGRHTARVEIDVKEVQWHEQRA